MSYQNIETLNLLMGFSTSVGLLVSLGALLVFAPPMDVPPFRWFLRALILLGIAAVALGWTLKGPIAQIPQVFTKEATSQESIALFFGKLWWVPAALTVILVIDLLSDFLIKGVLGKVFFLVASLLGASVLMMTFNQWNEMIFVYRLGVDLPPTSQSSHQDSPQVPLREMTKPLPQHGSTP